MSRPSHLLVQADHLVWAKDPHEHLGFVYAAGVAGGPTVGELRPEDRPMRLEVMQIRICAPRDLSITSFADWRRDDPLTLHRDLGQWVSPRDLAQLFVTSVETRRRQPLIPAPADGVASLSLKGCRLGLTPAPR